MLLQRIATPVLALLLLVTPAWGSEKPERIYIFALKAYQDGLYEVSADAFREYLASPGPGKQQAEAGLFLGQALLALGRDEEGLAALEVAAKTDSKASVAPLARMIRAQRYLDLVRYGEAEAESGRWLRYFPRHPLRWEVRLLRGRALSRLKRWDEAAALFKEVAEAEKALGELPVEALSRLAAVQTYQGKPEEAAAAWAALVERAPADPRAARALLHLAARTEQAGRFDEALAHVEALIATFPEAPEAGLAKVIRADSLFGLGRWSEAADEYREAAQGEGAVAFSPSKWERAGLAAYRAERFQEAADALARAGDGSDGSTLALRIRSLRKVGKPVETFKASTKLLASYPRSPWAAEALWPTITLARSTGRWEEVRKAVSDYVSGAPAAKEMEARSGLAHVELYGGRPGEAARLFGALAQAEGGLDRFRDVRYKRAVALVAAGRHITAVELIEDLSEQERAAAGSESILALEAHIQRAQGHYSAAADRYQSLLAQWPEAGAAGRWLLALAEMEQARGRSSEALEAYEKWLESRAGDPGAPTVRLATARLMVAVGRRDDAWASLEALGAGDDPELAAQAFLLQGRIAFEEHDYEAALKAAAKALEGLSAESPAHALARWRMARTLEEAGRPSDAATHYRWLAEHVEDDEVREASEEGLTRVTEVRRNAEKAKIKKKVEKVP